MTVVMALAAIWLFYQHLHVRSAPLDFYTYYFATKAAANGLNPYELGNLSALAGRPLVLPFVYPAVTLLVFAPFESLAVEVAGWVWMTVSGLLLAVLVWIWITRHLSRGGVVPVAIALAFSFNVASIWGLKMGNVVILETVLLWAAFAAYLEDRRVLFTALVVLASTFKILPIAFLALLLVPSKRSPAKPWLALSGLAALAVMILAPVWFGPSWAQGYAPPSIRPTGIVNPSALGLLDTIFGTGSDQPLRLGEQLNPALALWALYAVAIAAWSIRAMRRSWIRGDLRSLLLESVYAFVLLSPRPMIYSYVMLIPPVLVFGPPLLRRAGGFWMIMTLLVAPSVARWFGLIGRDVFWDNYPFLLTLGIWGMHVARGPERLQAKRGRRTPRSVTSTAKGQPARSR